MTEEWLRKVVRVDEDAAAAADDDDGDNGEKVAETSRKRWMKY